MAQVIKIVGLVDDGSALHPTLPRNTATEVQFPRAADVRVELDIFRNDGQRVLGGSGLVMTMQSRLVAGQPGPTLQKTGTFTDPGLGLITIAAVDMLIFQPMRLFYDIWLTVAGLKYQIVRTGIIRLEPNITANP